MNTPQTVRLGLCLISLIYLLPLITAVSTVTPDKSPALTVLLYLLALLFLILPAGGCLLYAQTVRPKKPFLLLGILSLPVAAGLVFLTPLFGIGLSGFDAVTHLICFNLWPVLLLLYLPVWFIIPDADKPQNLPQIPALLAPALMISYFLILGILGINIGPLEPCLSLLRSLSAAAGILAACILLYIALTRPESGLSADNAAHTG